MCYPRAYEQYVIVGLFVCPLMIRDTNIYIYNHDVYRYSTRCFLAKAYCSDSSIHKAHDGACAVSMTTTTPAPTTTIGVIDGSLIALDIFCLDLIYINCPLTGPAVCGSDGIFYPNMYVGTEYITV